MSFHTRPGRAIDRVEVVRWPSEIPLLILVAMASAGIWLVLALSIFGIFYVGLVGLVLFLAHVGFVAQVRGSAVRLGPQQFPELHGRVVELCWRAGIDPVPEAFLMESGGALNALATKMFRARMIILYADLLDACGKNEGARDMVIGHELGHIKAGHLNWMWLLTPGLMIPFLGSAYSRARELTCDRYGAALAGRQADALIGLAILAAGRSHGPRVDLASFVAQRRDLDTGWMTLGKWLAGHPPLCERIGALAPSLTGGLAASSTQGPLRAVGLLGAFLLVPAVAAAAFVIALIPHFKTTVEEAASVEQAGATTLAHEANEARANVERDLERIERLLIHVQRDTGRLPENEDALRVAWKQMHPLTPLPHDPFDGLLYGYELSPGEVTLWSSGPDGESGTSDDIYRVVRTEAP